MKIEFRGRANIPSYGPALLANKHQSESDGIFLASLIPGIACVAMQELFSYPLIGTILYRLQMIRVDACGGGKERDNLAQFRQARPRQRSLHRDLSRGQPDGAGRTRALPLRHLLSLSRSQPAVTRSRPRSACCGIAAMVEEAGPRRHRIPAADRDRARQADLHAPPRGDESKAASDRLIAEIHRPARHTSQLVLLFARPGWHRQPTTAPRAAP